MLNDLSWGYFLCRVASPTAFSFVFQSILRRGDLAVVAFLEKKKRPNEFLT